MSRLNHARLQHRGRQCEFALPYGMRRASNDNASAKAANAGRSLNAEERARVAASYGYKVA
tara:strand:- start:132 stop:314 length:183 start_codon:yes stop_codon:yes gene_type:complete